MRAAQRASRRGDVTRARAVSGLRAATLAVFVLAALLRLVLACVNREQSDNHVSVIDVMAFEHRIPDYDRDRDEVNSPAPNAVALLIPITFTGVELLAVVPVPS